MAGVYMAGVIDMAVVHAVRNSRRRRGRGVIWELSEKWEKADGILQ
jgi:hypothetical protein